jgi:broad specificity phosphatase PhoE
MGKLILVRHGHTHLDESGENKRLRGCLDVPLDEHGMQEAVETAERVARYPIQKIFSSDLRRARHLAELIKEHTKAPVVTTTELRPWDLGVFAGQRICDVLPFLDLLNQHPELPAPDGESFYHFYGRYSHRLSELMNLADESPNCIVAVTHHRNLLASPTIINHGDRDRVPVRGGAKAVTLMVVEKNTGKWTILRTDT